MKEILKKLENEFERKSWEESEQIFFEMYVVRGRYSFQTTCMAKTEQYPDGLSEDEALRSADVVFMKREYRKRLK